MNKLLAPLCLMLVLAACGKTETTTQVKSREDAGKAAQKTLEAISPKDAAKAKDMAKAIENDLNKKAEERGKAADDATK